MFDLVKSVLGGASSLIIGWMLPTYISLQLAVVLILPQISYIPTVGHFLHQPITSRQLTLAAVAVVAGLVLAAAQAPLYRVLEGYLFWPPKLCDYRIKKHQIRRRNLVSKQKAVAVTDRGVHSGLLYERAARYPAQDRQFAPTALGNAIRRFETYAGDRYRLDSQLMWHHLTSAAPDRAVAAVSSARTNVDFFICLLYGSAANAVLGVAVAISGHASLGIWAAIIGGMVFAVACYRLAVLATDEWDAAVRALIDHGRAGLAAAFGLRIPADFESERYMWRAINTLVRRPYTYSEEKNVAAILTRFRTINAEASNDTATYDGNGLPGSASLITQSVKDEGRP